MTTTIEIFTDGAAKGNPGNGGYGALLRFNGKIKELSQGYRKTTNNRMELLAVIVALESLKTNQYPVVVYSDSKYVVDAITQNWLYGWVKTNFKGKKNKDLWLRYLAVAKNFKIEFKWVKGHNGHPENERCDQLAVAAAESNNLLVDEEYEKLESEGGLFD
ncbi:MAG TPA: ribonuclease HI [Taishania sp.]|nr:ribonuclease HI [Taishania sp.]HNS41300.1 ribonuclease HI [Taishania sp.]